MGGSVPGKKDVEKNKELFEAYKKSRSIEDRNKIVENYLYIVKGLANRYRNKGVEYEDLCQVGYMALVLAVERYDPDKGVDFSYFATPTIIGEIKRYFRDKGWAVNVPRKMKDLSVKIKATQRALENELQRIPKVSEIAERLDVSEEDVLQAMESGNAFSTYSLQQKIDDDESAEGRESFLERYVGEEDSGFEALENADFIKRTIEKFTPEERYYCRIRFVERKKQKEIAEILGVSQMTVSRIEKKIRQKFREEYQR